jgi:SdpC family antimicrobial peptide
MKQRLKILAVVAAATASALAVGTPASAEFADPSAASMAGPSNGYSDEDYIRALVFNDGPLANKLALADSKPVNVSRTEYDALVTAFVDDLFANYPSEVAEVVRDLRSDNPLVIEGGLDALGSLLERQYNDAVAFEPAGSSEAPATGVTPTGALVGPVVAVAAAAVVGVVVAAALQVVVYKGNWFWSGSKSSVGPGEIPRTTLVAELAGL